jgi:hypothetical protein
MATGQSWPTPLASDARSNTPKLIHGTTPQLMAMISRWPTPTASDYRSGTNTTTRQGHAPPLNMAVRGRLNPSWVECLQGFPPGWTAINNERDIPKQPRRGKDGLPTLLRFKRRQRVVKTMFTAILDRVLYEAKKAGKLGPRVDTSYDIVFPEIDTSANPSLAQGLNYLIAGMATAKAHGWLSDETAMQLMFQFAGTEIDIHEEAQRVQSERKV